MINFSKFSLKKIKLNCFNQNLFRKNFFNSSQVKRDKKSGTDNMNLKEEFEEMLKTTKISDEELKTKINHEEKKKKETMENINKEWEERNKNLKEEWEEKRNSKDEENNSESKIKLDHIKKKVKSAFFFNKMNTTEGKTSHVESESETKEEKSEETSEKEKKSENKKSQSNSSSELGSFTKFYKGFINVWKQTFPGEENMDLLFEKRRQEALILKSKIKEATEEEIEQMEAAIPEWKRGAVVLVQDDSSQKIKTSIIDLAKMNLTKHIKNLKIYKEAQISYQNSEISLLMEDMKTSYSNVRDNLQESQNPLLVVSRDLADRVSFKSSSAQATTIMRKYDPNFELILFEKEVNGIFVQLMTAFIKDDLETVRLVAGEVALALLTNEIKSRRERVS